jgi:hypothetical protein
MAKEKTVRTSVELPEPVHRKLRETAARRGCSARSLIVEAVTRMVEEPRAEPVEPKKGRRRLSLDPPLVPTRGRGPIDLRNVYDYIDFP